MNYNNIVTLAKTCIKTVEADHKLPSKLAGLTIGEYGYILCKSVLNPMKDISQLSFGNAPLANGDSINQTLTKKEYQAIASDVNKFITANKRLPNYVKHQNKKINIHLAIYCFAKIVKFTSENKRLPVTCMFTSGVFKTTSTTSTTAKYTTKGGAVCKKLMNIAKMSINTYKDVYKAMSHFSYQYYYNDVKLQSKTLSDKAGNCTDLNQVMMAALKELGYTVRIVRGLVKCNDNKQYGHVWCQIKLNGVWTNIDASAAAKGKSLGQLICTKGYTITNINPSWAVTDDGRT